MNNQVWRKRSSKKPLHLAALFYVTGSTLAASGNAKCVTNSSRSKEEIPMLCRAWTVFYHLGRCRCRYTWNNIESHNGMIVLEISVMSNALEAACSTAERARPNMSQFLFLFTCTTVAVRLIFGSRPAVKEKSKKPLARRHIIYPRRSMMLPLLLPGSDVT